MNKLCSNFGHTSYSVENSSVFKGGLKEVSELVLSNTTDETVAKFSKMTVTIPYTNQCYADGKYLHFTAINTPKEVKNNAVYKKNTVTTFTSNDTLVGQMNTIRKKTKTNTTEVKVHNKNITHPEKIIKKQKNVSFSNQKLWEINRVNQILHTKLSNGVKPTYSRQNPSTATVMRATSTINREKKKKDIIQENIVSDISTKIECIV